MSRRKATCRTRMKGGTTCDREVHAEGHCICHLDDPDKDHHVFSSALQETLSVQSEGTEVDLTSFVFPRGFKLANVGCKSLVCLDNGKIYGGTAFCKVGFSGGLSADGLEIPKDEIVEFVECEMNGTTRLREMTIKGTFKWICCRISCDCDLSASSVLGELHIVHCIILRQFSLNSSHVKPQSMVLISQEGMDASDLECAPSFGFADMRVDSGSKIALREVDLSRATFRGTWISEWEFNKVTWATRVTFGRKVARRFGLHWVGAKVKRRIPLRVRRCFTRSKAYSRNAVYDEIALNVSWFRRFGRIWSGRVSWNDCRVSYAHVIQTYRQLQTSYASSFRYSEAGDFYVGEQEMRRLSKGLFREFFSMSFLYKLFSYYGESYQLPFNWLAATLLFAPFFLLLSGTYLPVHSSLNQTGQINIEYQFVDYSLLRGDFEIAPLLDDYGNAFYSNISFLMLNRRAVEMQLISPVQRVLVIFEILFILILVAFYLVGLRRAFKRKSF